MKQVTLTLFVLLIISQSVSSQSMYREKWKEGVYFEVPITFDQKILNDEKAIYTHRDGLAELQIYSWPLSFKASEQIQLDAAVLDLADRLNCSYSELVTKDIIQEYNPDPDFKGTRMTVKGGGKQTHIVALYSLKTQRNYAILVKANQEYANSYRRQLLMLSEGLEEF